MHDNMPLKFRAVPYVFNFSHCVSPFFFILNIKVTSQQRVSLEFNPLNTLKIEV